MMPATIVPNPTQPASGARLVTSDGRSLPLRGTRVVADACAGSARVTLEQRFVNVYSEPLSVTYQLPLPADGAVAGFAFSVAGARVEGRIEKRADARQLFEDAILEGKSAALLEQDRASVFRQEIGNIPPGEEARVEVTVDQPLAWLVEGEWEWRWPCVVAPRYLGASGRVDDAERVTTDVLAGEGDARAELALRVRDVLAAGAPSSPSHALAAREAGGEWRVSFHDDALAPLDRDLVVRWKVAQLEPGVTVDAARVPGAPERAFGLITLIPPTPNGHGPAMPRDLVVLLDTSGSMQGQPLAQAKAVVSALVRGLGANDQLELLAFGSKVTRFEKGPLAVTEPVRAEALGWIEALHAFGGTEMRDGIREAIAPIRPDAQRQVLLITDGLIGFETEVIGELLQKLPPSSTLHTLGVGSAVNRSLTGPAARAGRGSEHIVGIDEPVEPVLRRVLAKLEAPLVTNVRLSGSAVRNLGRARLPNLHAGAPVVIPVELAPNGGRVIVEGNTASGPFRRELDVSRWGEPASRSLPRTLYARERAEDLEMRRAAGESSTRIDPELEQLGLEFGIATAVTSWVAVLDEATVDPTLPARHVVQPQRLPHGMSAEGVGLRPATRVARFRSMAAIGPPMVAAAAPFAAMGGAPAASPEFSRGARDDGGDELWELTGKIISQKPDRLVVSVEVHVDFEWKLPERVTVELDDGTSIEAAVHTRTSTASIAAKAGQWLRLVLALTAPLVARPARLRFGGVRVTLER